MFALFALYRWRVHELRTQLTLRFEERLAERTRIAQDLHDTLLQGLVSASMQLHVANDHIDENAPAKPLVGRVMQLMGQVIEEGRDAVRGLRSTSGNADDLETAFSRAGQEFANEKVKDCRVIVEGTPRKLHPIIRDEAYRIGREALANAFRHSQANKIEIELEYSTKQLRILVRDDGTGIDSDVLQSGRDGHWGLAGMRERAESIGARLKVWSRANAGTEVELLIPSQVAFHKKKKDMSKSPIRVFSVDDHPLLREGIAALVNSQPDMVLIGQAATGAEAIQLFKEQLPDVTLLDLRLPDMSGIDVLIAIRSQFPEARIIMLTTFEGDVEIQRALQAGARGYLLKNMPPTELLEVIRQVHAGKKRIPPEIASQLLEHMSDEVLTEREIEVLREVADGNRNREIAERLFISEETVKVHIKHIMEKLGASDRTQAVSIGLRRGIIQL